MLGSSVTDDEILEFRNLLAQASEKRRHIRIIGVGEERVGKTSLCKRLLQRGKEDIGAIEKTQGIETHMYAATIVNGKVTVENVSGRYYTSNFSECKRSVRETFVCIYVQLNKCKFIIILL